MLTVSKPVKRWSIKYYNDTANQAKQASMDRQAAGGGLGEYYSEGDTRAPTWVVVGDTATGSVRLSGLDGAALAGRSPTRRPRRAGSTTAWPPTVPQGGRSPRPACTVSTWCSPHPRACRCCGRWTRRRRGKGGGAGASLSAVRAALTYLHQHAGYTRVHNPATGTKDLQRLPGLVSYRLPARDLAVR